jgi:hypothetical protein
MINRQFETVIVGGGHAGWLQQGVGRDAGYIANHIASKRSVLAEKFNSNMSEEVVRW